MNKLMSMLPCLGLVQQSSNLKVTHCYGYVKRGSSGIHFVDFTVQFHAVMLFFFTGTQLQIKM